MLSSTSAPDAGPGESRRPRAASLVLFVLLAVVHTWPLASAPATLSRNDTGDTVLHEWTLAWVAHQAVRDPLHLFDANIFYPDRNTLAYSDHLFVQAVMTAPIFWAGGSPVLAYNLLVILGLALTGWTTSLVVQRWTGSWLAGTLSGSLMAFNAFTLTRFAQVQDLHFEFFPLALLALDRLLTRPRVRFALTLAGWSVLHALTCGYLLVFGIISLGVATAVRPEPWSRRIRQVGPLLLLAGGTAGLALLPFLIPYFRASREQGLSRPLSEVSNYSAHVADYLATGGRLHFELWSHSFFSHYGLFPGLIAVVLAGIAVWSGVALKDHRARMAVAFGLVALALSFGPSFAPYRWLYDVFPLLRGVRGAVRFGQFFLAAVAILAGFGFSILEPRLRRRGFALGLLLIAGANLEALRAPLAYSPFHGIPRIYDALSGSGEAVVACFPLYTHDAISLNSKYMLASTRFWKPMLNGYSGFVPASFYRHGSALAGFPDPPSIEYLRSLGVSHVVVETHLVDPARLQQLDRVSQLQFWAGDGNVRIYRLQPLAPPAAGRE
jgi:hypothetical protein